MSDPDIATKDEALRVEAEECGEAMWRLTSDGLVASNDLRLSLIQIFRLAGSIYEEFGRWAVFTKADGERLVVPLSIAQQVAQA